jgi:hypothetical protein
MTQLSQEVELLLSSTNELLSRTGLAGVYHDLIIINSQLATVSREQGPKWS